MTDNGAKQDTQPISTPDARPLPAWILDWASREEEEEGEAPARELFFEEAETFVPPAFKQNDAWATEHEVLVETEPKSEIAPLSELQVEPSLDDLLFAGDIDATLALIKQKQDDPAFNQDAAKTIRKHLNLNPELDPLWDVYDKLNQE